MNKKSIIVASTIMIVIILAIIYQTIIKDNKEQMISSTKDVKMTKLIENEQFTNSTWSHKTVSKLIRSYGNRKITDNNINLICEYCKRYSIHPLIVLAKAEQENALITSYIGNYSRKKFRAMAYGLSISKYVNGKKVYKYGGFTNQVTNSIKLLRKAYDKWNPSKSHKINFGTKTIVPENAATYSLYVYCPFYGNYLNYGNPNKGNEIFVSIYKKFSKRWNKICMETNNEYN